MLGRLDEAEGEMRPVLEWARRLREEGNAEAVEWMGFARWELGEIAIANGRVRDGLRLLEHALTELEEARMPTWGADDWEKRNARVDELKEAHPEPEPPAEEEAPDTAELEEEPPDSTEGGEEGPPHYVGES